MDGTLVFEYPAIVLHIKDRITKDVFTAILTCLVVVYLTFYREGKFEINLPLQITSINLSIPPICSNSTSEI